MENIWTHGAKQHAMTSRGMFPTGSALFFALKQASWVEEQKYAGCVDSSSPGKLLLSWIINLLKIQFAPEAKIKTPEVNSHFSKEIFGRSTAYNGETKPPCTVYAGCSRDSCFKETPLEHTFACLCSVVLILPSREVKILGARTEAGNIWKPSSFLAEVLSAILSRKLSHKFVWSQNLPLADFTIGNLTKLFYWSADLSCRFFFWPSTPCILI